MLETVQLFYVVIRATRRSTRLQGKGSIYTSQYFETLSIGPAPGIKPPTSRSAIKRSNDCANPAAVMIENKSIFPDLFQSHNFSLDGETYYLSNDLPIWIYGQKPSSDKITQS